MLQPNLVIAALAAIVPLITGFIWYNPKVFGTAWIKTTGLSEDELKKGNMAMIFGLTYVFSFLLAMALHMLVIHQYGFQSVLQGEEGFGVENSNTMNILTEFFTNYGDRFRTFKHGVMHGVIAGFIIAMPILGINALFERKNFKYIAIHTGYWMLTLGLMGGIICQYS